MTAASLDRRVSSRPLQWLPQRAEDEAVEDEGERCHAEGPASPLVGGVGPEGPRSSRRVTGNPPPE